MRAALLVLVLLGGCTRPRHGLYTAGVGVGLIGAGFVAVAVIDGDKPAPGSGFVIGLGAAAAGLGLVAIGLVSALFLQLELRRPDESPPSGVHGVGWESASRLGDAAMAAAVAGDCQLAIKLASDARTVDPDYYDRVLLIDPALARCAR